jgi:hypothetical protein
LTIKEKVANKTILKGGKIMSKKTSSTSNGPSIHDTLFGHLNKKDRDLFERAEKGDISIMEDPRATTIKDKRGRTPLHYLAYNGNVEVLKHPQVATLASKEDDSRVTPLFALAVAGKVEVLEYPDVMKYRLEKFSNVTVLHVLANYSNDIDTILKHPLVDKVKDDKNRTPLYILAARGRLEVLDHPSVMDELENWGSPMRALLHRIANWLSNE